MSRQAFAAPRSPSRARRAESRALWILLAAGAALMLYAAIARGEAFFTARRTERFRATLAPGSTLRVENVFGDVVAARGASFSAVVTITVSAPSQEKADRTLAATRVVESREDEEYRLETRWPGDTLRRSRGARRGGLRCQDCRISTRFELLVPAGVDAVLSTVNGDVRARDLDGDLELSSVNGTVQALGTGRSLEAQTVNGRVEAAARALPSGATWELKTVNGPVLATLPRDARFDWNASTMWGTIASTFALPPARAQAPPAPRSAEGDRPRPARAPRSGVAQEGRNVEVVIDAERLAKQIEDSMREVEIDMKNSMREMQREERRMRLAIPGRRYEARVGGGGARVSASTLKGDITLLEEGTREADAKPLVSGRRPLVVSVPAIEIRVPQVRGRVPEVAVKPLRARVRPAPAPPAAPGEEEEVIRGDVSGDFLSTGNGGYQIGRVSGRVKILARSGEIHVGSAGGAADLKTYGGDIQIGPVLGDLKAQTLAGDIRAGEVTGSAVVETSGGDVRIDRIGESADARTAGGDIVLPAVAGGVHVETGGGEVRVGILSRRVEGGVSIRNAGGDVTLMLPANFQGDLDLSVVDAYNPEDTLIRSDFPAVSVTRGPGSQRASGVLNGGGSRVWVKTTSGTIRLRKGPAAPP